MRIAFDSRPAADDRGIGRYARSLLDALRADGRDVVERARPARDADVFHAPWIDGARLRSAIPQVVTLHDLVPLKRGREYLRTGLRFRLHYAAVKRADRVIVPTHAVRRDAERLLGLERVDVIAEAASAAFGPREPAEVERVRAKHGLPEGYLLWVGGLTHPDPRKRVRELALARRDLPLVLAGRTGPWTSELAGRAFLTGYVPDDELAALYTGAHALVFPSDDEGFGLPPVEALACGTPVVASDTPAVREVLEGRAELVAPDDLQGLLDAAHDAHRPAPAAPAWTWQDAARATWAVYGAATERRAVRNPAP